MSINRELKDIKLKNYTIKVPVELTWGEFNKINKINMANISNQGIDMLSIKDSERPMNIDYTKFIDSKYKVLAIVVKEIKDKEGRVIEYSDDFVDGLSYSDGDKLYNEVNNLMPNNKDDEIKKK